MQLLPIAILTTLSLVARSDTVPKFDVTRECRLESDVDRCSRDEADALDQLKTEWAQFCPYRQEDLYGRNDNRRLRQLCRPADLFGNGTRQRKRRQ